MQIGFLAFEEGMRPDLQKNIQVAGRAAIGARLPFVRQADSGSVVHAGRNVDLELLMYLLIAVPTALAAGIADDLSGSAAGTAGAADGEEALLINHLAAAVAGWTTGRFAARFGSGSGALGAALHAGYLDLGSQTVDGLFEAEFQVVADVLAALRASAPAAASSGPAEEVAEAEEITQNIAEIGESLGVESRLSGALQPGVTKAVVGGPLLRIAEHTVRLGSFLELLFASGVVGVVIGMILASQLAVRTLDVGIAGVLGDTQNFVVISFRHSSHCFTASLQP